MLKRLAQFQRGVTLIEIMISLVVLGVAISLGVPAFSEWIQNTQIRTAAESLQSGLQLARAEGLRRNATVRFQLMTSVDAGCAVSAAGTNWVISVNDASGKCDVTDSTQDPFITRFKASAEATRNVTFTASQSSVNFSGLGLVTPTPAATITIDLENPTGGTCVKDGGKMRCLRIQITSAGQVRMCDQAVTANTDPRKC